MGIAAAGTVAGEVASGHEPAAGDDRDEVLVAVGRGNPESAPSGERWHRQGKSESRGPTETACKPLLSYLFLTARSRDRVCTE